MVTYTADQWKKSKWDLSAIPEGKSLFDLYPDLRAEMKTMAHAYAANNNVDIAYEKIVHYIVMVYHQGSPHAIYEQNIIKRKIDVCEAIGLDVSSSSVKRMIANKIPFVNNAVLFFLKMECNIDWLELQEYLDAYYQIILALTDDSGDTGKSKTTQDIARTKLQIVKEIKSIKSEIETLSAKIFSQDSDLLNKVERFYEDERESFIVLSPEDYAKQLRNGAQV